MCVMYQYLIFYELLVAMYHQRNITHHATYLPVYVYKIYLTCLQIRWNKDGQSRQCCRHHARCNLGMPMYLLELFTPIMDKQ